MLGCDDCRGAEGAVLISPKIADQILEARSPKHRKSTKLFGFGINDSVFSVTGDIGGTRYVHRCYRAWSHMIMRCYDRTYLIKKPTYGKVTVCEEWLSFMGFYHWWKQNHKEGYQLDKDLLKPNSKIYSPDTCIYLPSSINNFTIDNAAKRGSLPIGVRLEKGIKKYSAAIRVNGCRVRLGYFSDEQSAHDAWFKAKMEIAQSMKVLCDHLHPELHSGLLEKVMSLRSYKIQNPSP